MKNIKSILTFAIILASASVAHTTSADTFYVSTPSGTTTISASLTKSTYAPGEEVKVNVSSITTNDSNTTNVTFTGGSTTLFNNAAIDTSTTLSRIATTVATAPAPGSGYILALTASVTYNVPLLVLGYLHLECNGCIAPVWATWNNESNNQWYDVNLSSSGSSAGGATGLSVNVPPANYSFVNFGAGRDRGADYQSPCPGDQYLRLSFYGNYFGQTQYVGGSSTFTVGLECI